jgi:ElaB/YqjD/DUF883 family membrane-anchored ribosome-binding protein
MIPEGSLQGNGGHVGRLQKVVVPIRSGLSDAAEGLSHAMTRVNSMVGDMRLMSARDFMARSPLIALVVAAGIGFLVGLSRSRRR